MHWCNISWHIPQVKCSSYKSSSFVALVVVVVVVEVATGKFDKIEDDEAEDEDGGVCFVGDEDVADGDDGANFEGEGGFADEFEEEGEGNGGALVSGEGGDSKADFFAIFEVDEDTKEDGDENEDDFFGVVGLMEANLRDCSMALAALFNFFSTGSASTFFCSRDRL